METVVLLLSCLGMATLSAVLPWMNAELMLFSFSALAPSRTAVAGLIVACTLGQMAGKSALYWSCRRTGRLEPTALAPVMTRLRVRLSRTPHSANSLMLASSAIGLPPFYLVTMASGALQVNFWRFLVAGTLGRVIRFSVVAFVPGWLGHALR